MIRNWIGTAVSALIVFLTLWLALRRVTGEFTALLVGGLFGGMVLLVGSILVFRSSVNVMSDLNMKCPHCGKSFEAAFINDQLAMELECPHCGKTIIPGTGVKPDESAN